jgi:hypothetical protein
MFGRMFTVFLALGAAGVVFVAPPAWADLVVSFADSPVVITFDDTLAGVNQNKFLGEGLAPTPSFGQLDSDSWEIDAGSALLPFGGSASTGTIFAAAASTGNTSVAGLYSFDTGGGNSTLGIQPHVDHYSPGTIILRVLNNTGTTVSLWNVSYEIFAYNDTNASTSIDFSYAVGMTTPGSFTPLALGFNTTSMQDDVAAWSGPMNESTAIPASVADSTHLFLKWTFNSTGGTSVVHDEIALDNISVMAVAVPEPSAAIFALAATVATFLRVVFKCTKRRSALSTNKDGATASGSLADATVRSRELPAGRRAHGTS